MNNSTRGLSLWTLAPHSNADTSRDAAKAIEPHLERLERDVYDFVERGGRLLGIGFTREEIGFGLGLSGDTVRPRVLSLIAKGLLVETDETRRTASGRNARVLRVVEK